jgi:ABC-type uncharacterized transport system permease subunit
MGSIWLCPLNNMLDNMLAVTFNVISCSFYARHHMLNVVLNSLLNACLIVYLMDCT